jgi:hypothetical protein
MWQTIGSNESPGCFHAAKRDQRRHLCAAVDHVDLVQRDDVHHLPAPLQLPVWTLHEARCWTCGVQSQS